MTLLDLAQRLNHLMNVEFWQSRDSSLNGLQVGDEHLEVSHVAFAVDACVESFERALGLGAQALVVHHGLFWGKPFALTGHHFQRISRLVLGRLGLLAYHLPLDAHPELGNNVTIARRLGLSDVEPFCLYKGATIGFKGKLAEPVDFRTWLDQIFDHERERFLSVLDFGPRTVQTVGIVSGGAPWEIEQAIQAGLDVFLTGDAQHAVYHVAQEAGIHLISAGHYFTETWGVYALSEYVRREWGLRTSFLDLPTGL